jgi:predicted ester cyclase
MKKLFTIIPLVFMLCFTFSCQQQSDGRSKEERAIKATSDEYEALVVRFFDEVDRENYNVVTSELLSPDYQDHMPGTKKSKSWEELRGTIDVWHRGFPDLNHTIHDVFSDGNKVVARGITRGTHKGKFAGFEPTGEEISLTFICIFQVEDGKLTDRWPQFDYYGWLEQLRANAEKEVAL